jgi:ABC-type transporter Mla subunit MlaD
MQRPRVDLTVGNGGYILLPPIPMENDQTPATKADLRRLETSLLEKMDTKLGGLHEAIDRVLTVLVNVEKRLTKTVDNHETRIRRLEDRVGVSAV